MTPSTREKGNLRQVAAIASLAVAAFMIALKIAAYFTTESAGVLSSLMDSMLDGIAATVTLIGVRQAQRPPSRSYRFGRGKAEPLAALAQAAFIFGSAVLLAVEVGNRLFQPVAVRYEWWGIGALGIASLAIGGLLLFQFYVVRQTGSIAIRADFRHYIGDVVINLTVMVGLALTMTTGLSVFDTVLALAVAGFLVVTSWSVARSALRLLMDRELDGEERRRITDCAMSHPLARGVHDLRTRDSGTKRFVEFHLELDGHLSLTRSHEVADEIEQRLREIFPNTEILIHQEPEGLDDQRLDHDIAEK